ncbi:uncharacterized protein EDB93DRAFT_1242162 [Suillus bovinus]|uniref:uncharacterized protein n=1 Tax=Suillus bovinus TaxID=48563 RepID=UPI001B869ACA|nr:uncharacterized protein EDB93DRAFT_1242162 [Suillus bovinus]KAG2138088.1 hypothetical protein EDB93DRAFT_1242162 [Suillus bovinus]
MSGSYVLLQFGSDIFNHGFEDLESRPAFTVVNLIVHIAREAAWSQQHPEIMGPSNSFLYFGPSKTPGYLVYGNGPEITLFYGAQNGKELKWKVFPQKMECFDGRSTVATWELSLTMVTEILTTLFLNRIALVLDWKL